MRQHADQQIGRGALPVLPEVHGVRFGTEQQIAARRVGTSEGSDQHGAVAETLQNSGETGRILVQLTQRVGWIEPFLHGGQGALHRTEGAARLGVDQTAVGVEIEQPLQAQVVPDGGEGVLQPGEQIAAAVEAVTHQNEGVVQAFVRHLRDLEMRVLLGDIDDKTVPALGFPAVQGRVDQREEPFKSAHRGPQRLDKTRLSC